ncbi:MAG: sigma-54 dependent transcriptional regulator [Candidatus Krumholzibacteriia bacterium]
MTELLIIDDDRAIRRSLELHLAGRGFRVHQAGDLAAGEALWREVGPDAVILDLKLPDGEGLDLLERMQLEPPLAPVIMITGHDDMEKAALAIQAGAVDYVRKPLDVDALDAVLDAALAQRRAAGPPALDAGGADSGPPHRIIGKSRAILELHKAIGRAARGRASVLIRGESGTGKELVARALHRAIAPEAPFVAVNCSALVPTLLESELFGHERGAFTGASSRREGRLELAGAGVLFLDEIGDLPLDLQAKLLRVLQEREFQRVGGNRSLPFRAVPIAATHRDLEARVADGSFREDLYFRLRVVEIVVPPLRERREDIPLLVEHFLALYNARFHRRVSKVSRATLAQLEAHDWPGNVRELENRLQAGIMASPGESLVLDLAADAAPIAPTPAGDWQRSLAEVEAEHIRRVLDACGWNQGRACAVLGISRPTLRKKIADYGLRED